MVFYDRYDLASQGGWRTNDTASRNKVLQVTTCDKTIYFEIGAHEVVQHKLPELHHQHNLLMETLVAVYFAEHFSDDATFASITKKPTTDSLQPPPTLYNPLSTLHNSLPTFHNHQPTDSTEQEKSLTV